jgi:hypothetical protein
MTMNSYYLLSKLEKFRALIDTRSSIVKIIRKIANYRNIASDLIDALEELAAQIDNQSERQDIQETVQNEELDCQAIIRIRSNQIRSGMAEVYPKQFFVGISNLEEAIDDLIQEFGKDRNPFSGLRNNLENFNRRYELFFQDGSYKNMLNVVYSANNLIEGFEIILKFIDSLKKNLLEHIEYGESSQEMTIFLTSSYSCREFIEKLNTIQKVYSELCFLTNISESEFPLRIIKIESNSLFAKIFGEAKVVRILGELIKDAISFLYRRFTNEGKIEAISKQTEAVEKVLELTKKLEEAGIDTSESKEMIRKSGVIIADNLNRLLLGEPEIELNGESISLDSNLKQKYLESGQVYLLKGDTAEPENT